MRLSPHAAQASQKALSRTRSRWCMTFTIRLCCRLAYRGKLHQRVTAVICFASYVGWADALVTRHLMEVSSLARGVLLPLGSTPIRLMTRRLSLPPSSFTRSAIGFPCGSLSHVGALRAYHVPSVYPCGEGLISTPGGRHLRPVRPEHRFLTPYLLVQASQHLALVLTHDASNDALTLTIPHHPSPFDHVMLVVVGTLSQQFHTPPLPVTHVLVGYW